LNSYNLFSTVDFPTRIQKLSKSAIDNIFIDYSRLGAFKATPIFNGLSDHDNQFILIYDIMLSSSLQNHWKIRGTDKFSLVDFNYKLSFEIWSEVFEGNDVNTTFNSFLNTFLRHAYATFPKSSAKLHNINNNKWITSSIKTKVMLRDIYTLLVGTVMIPLLINFIKHIPSPWHVTF
jgi:hypothetical protein